MPDDSMQQLSQPAAVGGISGLLGVLFTYLGAATSFVKKSEMETAIANAKLQAQSELNIYKVEVAEKYITRESLKETIRPLEENLEYIRDCVDSLREKKEPERQ